MGLIEDQVEIRRDANLWSRVERLQELLSLERGNQERETYTVRPISGVNSVALRAIATSGVQIIAAHFLDSSGSPVVL